jgi:hypothetical protein
MYCSSCGIAVAQNLIYCNHCGAKLGNQKTESLIKTSEMRQESIIMAAMVFLFVLGLPVISVMLGVMKENLNFAFGPLVAFALLSFSILVALEGVLISRLFRRKRDGENAVGKSSAEFHITKELEAHSRVVSEPVTSVTDHTTRTLDPVYGERK